MKNLSLHIKTCQTPPYINNSFLFKLILILSPKTKQDKTKKKNPLKYSNVK